ncbi:hypothetical protein [Tautonia marina]|uniref:hypothetical protein n=1 Tax=Tautonia marina TaxID=2653855 RepID=UPI001260E990|nr:hypothetical protein [Tautonia marina]
MFPIVATAFVGLLAQPLYVVAATVSITTFSADGSTVPPGTKLHVAGNTSWLTSSVDTVQVRVRHSNSGDITDSMGLLVTKLPAPARFGTWDSLDSGPYAKTATGHTSGDTYFVEVEAYNAAVGPFNPSVEDSVDFVIN